MNLRTLCVIVLSVFLAVPVFGQSKRAQNRIPFPTWNINDERLDLLVYAIAEAEGFGVKHAVPTRYHNPGDIRSYRKTRYPGQVGLATKNHYVVFKNDQAGFDALKSLVIKIVAGQSSHYPSNTTIRNMAKSYAGNWRRWSKNVCRVLDIPDTTTLRSYLMPQVQVPMINAEALDLRVLMAYNSPIPRLE